MDVILKQSGDRICVYIDKKLVTISEGKSVQQVADCIKKSLKGVKIYIAR